MTDEPRPQAEQFSATGGHEESDVGIGLITVFVVVFALIIAVSMPLLWWLIQHWETKAETTDPDLPRLANMRAEPPRPRLQAAPARDYGEFRDEQLSRLNGAGWVDREQGAVHIPIERAIELVLQEGLPQAKRSEQDGAPRTDRGSSDSSQRPASKSREPSVGAPEDNPDRSANPPDGQDDREPGNRSEVPPLGDEVDG
jgi:hypothetical protein